MNRASLKLVFLGYGCAILSLFFGGDTVQVCIAIGLGVAGLLIGLLAASRGRPRNGIAILILSVIFAYLGATGFYQGFIEGFAQAYQAARLAHQGQVQQ
jgi:hypothetical protein